MKKNITIGLFGTCGNSKWRDEFIKKYEELGINYYNPQVLDGTWCPENAKIEAEHLSRDEIILFPILKDTYGMGSLSEVGFSILNAVNINNRRNFIILIDDKVDKSLIDENMINASNTSRVLVKEHLKKLQLSNIYLANTLEEMLDVSRILYQSEILKLSVEKYSVSIKQS